MTSFPQSGLFEALEGGAYKAKNAHRKMER